MTPMHPHPQPTAPRFSRLWWLGKAHSAFWIVLATLLIWVYADMEFTDEVKLKSTLSLTTGESKTVALLGNTQFELSFTLSGSKTALLQFRHDLNARGSMLSYDVSQEYAAGERSINAATLLEKAAGLTRRGITIKDIQPEAIPLNLDRLTVLPDVPVDLDAQGATFRLTGEAPKVELRVAESRWKKIQERLQGLPPRLKTVPVNLKELPPDKPVVAEVNPILETQPVTTTPKTVTFAVEVISTRVTQDVPVTIRLLCPAAWSEANNTTWKDYVFVPNTASDWRPKLTLEGEPKDLKPENVRAYIELTDDDKKGTASWLPRDVIVSFPPEVNLRLIGPAPKVQFRLEKRKPPVATPTIP
ncbi:MAG: hypothetical protein JXA11_15785 [Phycisphaerae bacterium]|nr:hypothetical protein [Phycisphaerae bacterium]